MIRRQKNHNRNEREIPQRKTFRRSFFVPGGSLRTLR
jgi:hypothetical protein